MANGVFLYREDSRYDDRPWAVYQFPEPYLSRANQMVGDWVIYMEPVVQADYTKSRVDPAADHGHTPAAYRVTRDLLRDKAKGAAALVLEVRRGNTVLLVPLRSQ